MPSGKSRGGCPNNQSIPSILKPFMMEHILDLGYTMLEIVLVTNEAPSTDTSRKPEPRFKGAFQITKVLDNERYVVDELPCSKHKTRRYSSVYASDGMKPWCFLPLECDDDQNDHDDYESLNDDAH